ncbi:MAG: hypothetical protein FJX74_05115 [Armatimonadetes bacterium]|nr:hypothetical protein [Armatimonadota bacterium]
MGRWSGLAAAVLIAGAAGGWARAQGGAPHIGYVYPAGGCQGTTFRVTVGGQFLRNADGAHVSGEGVRASVAEYVRPLDDGELGDVGRFLYQLVRRRWSARVMEAVATEEATEPPLPDHPWLRDMDGRSPAELRELRTRLFDEKKQPNAQIEEQVEVEVTVDPEAPPGERELRLATPLGLSNPMRFEVGGLPEVREADLAGVEDSDPRAVDLPVVINGQITPGDVDRFRLRAREGQRLVIRTQARRLIPYLADAVPGWFQATMTLRDPHGVEVAYEDDYRFDPDPVLLYAVPEDGVYELEVRDAIYRGRDDFVYRLSAGELPFITHVFPLGGPAGAQTTVSVAGWNLPTDRLTLPTERDGPPLRSVSLGGQAGPSLEVPYAVGDLPEALETEPNDSPEAAQPVMTPLTMNGRIGEPGDVDVFRFEGRAGDEVVAEVLARRLGSPLDSALWLLDAEGNPVALNDDHPDPETGLITHQADSYVRGRLPGDGTYRLVLADTQHQGGEAFAYRLRVAPPRPDFSVRVTPSTVSLAPGRGATVTFHAVRRDGLAGEIDVSLSNAPEGWALSQWRIPADKDSVEATLTAPRGLSRKTITLRFEAQAVVDGAPVLRPVTPAEDMMQAFLYRHLVAQEEFLAAVTGSRPVPAVWRPLVPGARPRIGPAPVRIPLGGTAQVLVEAPATLPDRRQTPLAETRFALSDPPRGLVLQEAVVGPTGVTLTLKADPYIAHAGDVSNLIVEAFTDVAGDPSTQEPGARAQRVSLGVLPAIPFEVERP